MGKTAIIIGSTGLVGKELLKLLLSGKEYSRVISFNRSPLNVSHPKLEERLMNFDLLENQKGLPPIDDVFCCLGTTIKKAKTQEVMMRIDVDYPLALARLTKKLGAKQYLVISSMGANEKSTVFYSRMKGILEEELKKVGFPGLFIFRPSLLLGERSEFRLGEAAAVVLMPIFSVIMIGPLAKYRAIRAKTVASGMFQAAQLEKAGVHLLLSDEIQKLGNNKS